MFKVLVYLLRVTTTIQLPNNPTLPLSARQQRERRESSTSFVASRDTYSLTHTLGRGNLHVCVRTLACALSVQSRALIYYIFPCVQYRCILFRPITFPIFVVFIYLLSPKYIFTGSLRSIQLSKQLTLFIMWSVHPLSINLCISSPSLP